MLQMEIDKEVKLIYFNENTFRKNINSNTFEHKQKI